MSAPLGTGRSDTGRRGAVTRTRPRLRPPARPPARSRLRAVPSRAPRPHGAAFVVLLVIVLAVGMVGLLMLNTSMQRSAFALEDLQDRAASLTVRRQLLEQQVQRMRSPERLARRATDLGMVQMASPVFLRLEDGRVLGAPSAALAGTGPRLVPVEPEPDVAEPLLVRQPLRTDTARPDPQADSRRDRGGERR